jgi:branched-chain amino acid transport system permease protein
MKPMKNGIVYLLVLIGLLFVPRLISLHDLMLFEYALTFAIVGLGFNLLLGYTGLLSFGHGAYFAAGAYTVAMISRYLPEWYRLEILIPAALFFSLLIALIFGFLCVRHTKVFFSILALSLSMVLFALLFKLYGLTGGSDGVRVPIPALLGFDFEGVRRPEFLQKTYYYLLLALFAASYLVMKGIVNSPFGKALQAVRDNEVRAELIGIRVRRYRLYAFAISGMFTGLGGALWSFINGHVTPELSHWVFSGELVYMVLLGGFGLLEGPVIGAILFTYLKLYAMSYTQYWMFVIGATFIVLVMVLPAGVAGAAVNLWQKLKTAKAG